MIFQLKHLIFMMGNINEMQEVNIILFREYDYINIPLNQRISQSILQKIVHMIVCKNDIINLRCHVPKNQSENFMKMIVLSFLFYDQFLFQILKCCVSSVIKTQGIS